MINVTHAGKIASNLPGLLLKAEQVAHGFMKGAHGRRKVGGGEAFWQFRSWQEGDSSRDVDWRQTAKREDIFITQREWEASQSLYLYRDSSASMNFTSADKFLKKKDYAEIVLLATAMVALNGGEQVGLLGASLPLQSGYMAAQKMAEYLPHQQEFLQSEEVLSRSHVVIISDFYYPLDNLLKLCESLAVRNIKGLLVQVYDPAEKSLPYKGRIMFHDIEGKNTQLVANVQAVRETYFKRFAAHQKNIEKIAGELNWDFKSFSTAIKLEDALTQIYDTLSMRL